MVATFRGYLRLMTSRLRLPRFSKGNISSAIWLNEDGLVDISQNYPLDSLSGRDILFDQLQGKHSRSATSSNNPWTNLPGQVKRWREAEEAR
jgi:hypothetical protein